MHETGSPTTAETPYEKRKRKRKNQNKVIRKQPTNFLNRRVKGKGLVVIQQAMLSPYHPLPTNYPQFGHQSFTNHSPKSTHPIVTGGVATQ